MELTVPPALHFLPSSLTLVSLGPQEIPVLKTLRHNPVSANQNSPKCLKVCVSRKGSRKEVYFKTAKLGFGQRYPRMISGVKVFFLLKYGYPGLCPNTLT